MCHIRWRALRHTATSYGNVGSWEHNGGVRPNGQPQLMNHYQLLDHTRDLAVNSCLGISLLGIINMVSPESRPQGSGYWTCR